MITKSCHTARNLKGGAMKTSFIGKSVLIRADRAGVFVGILKEKDGASVILKNARRLWYWDGAASISQIAMSGVSKPENCKFPEAVAEAQIEGVIEILPMTEKAVKSINSVVVWSK
jgi:hypothetical protein